jgi:hypothetical protein
MLNCQASIIALMHGMLIVWKHEFRGLNKHQQWSWASQWQEVRQCALLRWICSYLDLTFPLSASGQESQSVVAASACLQNGMQMAQAYRLQQSPSLIEPGVLVSLTKVHFCFRRQCKLSRTPVLTHSLSIFLRLVFARILQSSIIFTLVKNCQNGLSSIEMGHPKEILMHFYRQKLQALDTLLLNFVQSMEWIHAITQSAEELVVPFAHQ